MNVRTQSLRKLVSVAATATVLATSIATFAAPAATYAATNCVLEQGSTTVYPSLVQAQPGFSGAVTNPQPAWPTGQKLGCDTTLVANGSGTGKSALIAFYTASGAAIDMAASSSPLASGAEQNDLMAFQVGGDAMVIVVNSTNPVDQISMAEVTAIYNNQLQDWSGLADANGKSGTILARTRIIGSGTRDDMNRLFHMDRGTGVGNTCSTGFTPSNCEPALVARLGLPRLTTSQDEADAVCNSADSIAYTSLANLAAFGPGTAGCTGAGAIAGSHMKALTLQGCTYTGYPGTAPSCSGSFIAPSVTSAAASGSYPAKRQLFLTLPKVSIAAAKWGTGNGTGWTDQLGLTKAEDIVNYMESTQGQTAMAAVGFIPISVPSKQPIPDADVDLNGGIGLTDIGQITGRWNRLDTIPGSVRADVDNSGGVGLTDIGKITGQWGATGFVAP